MVLVAGSTCAHGENEVCGVWGAGWDEDWGACAWCFGWELVGMRAEGVVVDDG